MVDIRKQVAEWMAEQKIGAEKVGQMLGVTKQNIYDKLKENRKPNFNSMYQIAKALGHDGYIRYKSTAPDFVPLSAVAKMTGTEKQLAYDTVQELLELLGFEIVYTDSTKK